MTGFKRFENTDKYPKKVDFQHYLLFKIGDIADKLTLKQVMNKLGTPELAFAGHLPAAQILDCDVKAVKLFQKRDYIFSLINDDDALRQAKRDYNAKTRKLQADFLNFLAEDLGFNHLPNANKIANYAWQEGHSTGYQSVYDIACEMAYLFLPPELTELLLTSQELVTTMKEEYGEDHLPSLAVNAQNAINKFKVSADL